MSDDDEPELAGYEPIERPLRRRRMIIMRVVVVLALAGLVLPGIVSGITTANRSAQRACEIYAAYYADNAAGYTARFDLISDAGTGWNCYAITTDGDEVFIQSLGLIPGRVSLPTVPLEES